MIIFELKTPKKNWNWKINNQNFEALENFQYFYKKSVTKKGRKYPKNEQRLRAEVAGTVLF